MTLAEFGVDPDEPDTHEPRYEFEAVEGSWSLVSATVDESETPATTRCPDCGQALGSISPVLLNYGRDDGLLLACRLCRNCRNVISAHTAGETDQVEYAWELGYNYSRLPLYESERALDGEYPDWGVHSLDLDGDLPRGEQP